MERHWDQVITPLWSAYLLTATGAEGSRSGGPRSLSLSLSGPRTGSSSLLASRLNTSHSPMAESSPGAGVFPPGQTTRLTCRVPSSCHPLCSPFRVWSQRQQKNLLPVPSLAPVISHVLAPGQPKKIMDLYFPPLPSYQRLSLPHQGP